MKTRLLQLFSIVALFLACVLNGNSQTKVSEVLLESSVAWTEGSIMLNDGTELKGLLKCSDNTGILNYENGNTSRSFTSKSVTGFEFFDESLNKQRIFYSLLSEDPATNLKKHSFFEVLKEFKAFAVLSKTDPVTVEKKTNSAIYPTYPAAGMMTPTTVGIEIAQTETIYIMNPKGDIKPYLKIEERDIDGWVFDRNKTKNKIVDKDLLKEYTGKHYEALEEFADKNDLSFKRKQDLMKIIEHYQQLIGQ